MRWQRHNKSTTSMKKPFTLKQLAIHAARNGLVCEVTANGETFAVTLNQQRTSRRKDGKKVFTIVNLDTLELASYVAKT